MTPIDQQLREKWEKEAREHYINYSYTTTHMIEAYVDGCLARHREYQERVATLEGLLREIEEEEEVTHTVFFGENLKRLRAALSPPPAKQQEL